MNWIERVGQIREIRRGESVAGNGALQRIAEIVVLVGSIINAEAGADDRLAAAGRRRPGEADARTPVVRIGIIERRALWAEAAATLDIDHRGAVQNLVRYRVELISQAEVQGQVRRDLELILRVAREERPAVAANAFPFEDRRAVGAVVDEIAE